MRVVAIIINYRTPELVIRCLSALAEERAAVPDLRAVVADNNSKDGSAERLSVELSNGAFADWVEFVALPVNGGFGWGNNQAILHYLQGQSLPDAIYLLNPDTSVEPGALSALVRDLEGKADAGAVGSQLLNVDGSFAGSAFRFPSIGREFTRGLGIGRVERLLGIEPTLVPFGVRQPVDWVTGASVLIRTAAIADTGLFDTGFFLYFEEVELMYRLKKHGWQTYHCPESRVIHIAGASTGVVNGKTDGDRPPPDYFFQSRERFFILTGGKLRSLVADLAWLLGAAMASIVRVFLLGHHWAPSISERGALFRIGLEARDGDTLPAISHFGDRVGELPAWMQE